MRVDHAVWKFAIFLGYQGSLDQTFEELVSSHMQKLDSDREASEHAMEEFIRETLDPFFEKCFGSRE